VHHEPITYQNSNILVVVVVVVVVGLHCTFIMSLL